MGSVHNKPTYQTWQDMKQRCLNPKCHNFKNYGGRGITICQRWLLFENFLEDMGPRPPKLTIERVNNDGNYEPSNCRWADRKEQRKNQRGNVFLEKDGVRLTVEDWAKRIGRHPATLRSRIKRGFPADLILSPIKYRTGKAKVQSAMQQKGEE